MTRWHSVDLAHTPSQPWRNGGGTTQELLTWPGSSQRLTAPQRSDWQLRVSVAHIQHSGPFSPFPEVQRGFVVLQGAGVRLALPQGVRTLERGDDPLWFDGESAPVCELIDGPTVDLNFMVRRGAGTPRLAPAGPGSSIEGSTAWRGLFALGSVLLEIERVSEPVPAGTLAWSDAFDVPPWTLHPGHPGPAWWLVLER